MKHIYVFLILFCFGCGTAPSTSSATPAPAAQPAASPAAQPSPSPVAAAPAPGPAAAALATSDNDKGSVRAEVTELKRISGDMLMLRVALVNTGGEEFNLSTEYTDSHSSDAFSVGGITLVDPVNKKKYFVVRDGANHCVCSDSLSTLKPGARIVTWARFPAPPEDVTKISILLPHHPPMDDVAIAR